MSNYSIYKTQLGADYVSYKKSNHKKPKTHFSKYEICKRHKIITDDYTKVTCGRCLNFIKKAKVVNSLSTVPDYFGYMK